MLIMPHCIQCPDQLHLEGFVKSWSRINVSYVGKNLVRDLWIAGEEGPLL